MSETSIHPPPGARLMFASRHPHQTPSSTSPTHHNHRVSDDFISNLTPLTALDALRAPTGPLKTCMALATPAEQSFAIRAAVASKDIYQWLEELRNWSWSSQGGLGFKTPAFVKDNSSRDRSGCTAEELAEEGAPRLEETYIGSLLKSDLNRYETRLDQIQTELDKLEMEEIKTHVLHNHIMPLSRPGTPASPTLERQLRMGSLAPYTKMDDITAVITATVVQALPNLSKLIRLMSTWSVRLTVLRRIPTWLSSVEDAESAVQAGRDSINSEPKPSVDQSSDGDSTAATAFSKHDFDVMKLVLEKKVANAAQHLDYMLDTLEGRDDTLPDDWLDRMENVERGYAEWAAACEKTLRDAEVAALERQAKQAALAEAAEDPENEESEADETFYDDTVLINVEHADGDEDQEISFVSDDADQPIPSVEDADVLSKSPAIAITDEMGATTESGSSGENTPVDGDVEGEEFSPAPRTKTEPNTPILRVPKTRGAKKVPSLAQRRARSPARTPDLVSSSGTRNSPHTPPRESRSASLALSDMPPVPEDPEDDEDPLQTPLNSSYESAAHELGSPIILSDPNGEDDHLRRQISEILENIPAKIQLSSKASFLSHLNPPDLQLPYSRPRSTSDKSTRSKSSMSSRSSTPAFMLAPVARPRHQRGNQDIKMYHLSRANGEAPIKLFIRCVGANGERVMVRVGGGWADLGEYLKEYAIHHGRRSNQANESKVEVRDIPRSVSSMSNRPSASPPNRYSPPSRPASALDVSPIFVKKTRKPSAGEDLLGPRLPRTPLAYGASRASEPPSSGSASGSTGRSRSSSRVSWTEEDSSLGMAGPRSSRKEIPQESLDWVESIKEKVRAASGGSDLARSAAAAAASEQGSGRSGKFGELGKVGGTKRLFRKAT